MQFYIERTSWGKVEQEKKRDLPPFYSSAGMVEGTDLSSECMSKAAWTVVCSKPGLWLLCCTFSMFLLSWEIQSIKLHRSLCVICVSGSSLSLSILVESLFERSFHTFHVPLLFGAFFFFFCLLPFAFCNFQALWHWMSVSEHPP